jgi:hypothetical protein
MQSSDIPTIINFFLKLIFFSQDKHTTFSIFMLQCRRENSDDELFFDEQERRRRRQKHNEETNGWRAFLFQCNIVVSFVLPKTFMLQRRKKHNTRQKERNTQQPTSTHLQNDVFLTSKKNIVPVGQVHPLLDI